MIFRGWLYLLWKQTVENSKRIDNEKFKHAKVQMLVISLYWFAAQQQTPKICFFYLLKI